MAFPIVPRAVLETYFETYDKPTENQFGEFLSSYIHKTDDPNFTGLSDWKPNVQYLQGQCAVNPGNKRVYRCKSDVPPAPPSIPLSNTTYWEQLNGDLVIVTETSIATCLNIKAQTQANTGDVLFVKFAASPQGLAIYRYVTSGYSELLPYTIQSADGGFWVAVTGEYAVRGDLLTLRANAFNAQTAIIQNLEAQTQAVLADAIVGRLRGGIRFITLNGGTDVALDNDHCIYRTGNAPATIQINTAGNNQARWLIIRNSANNTLTVENTNSFLAPYVIPAFGSVMLFFTSGSGSNREAIVFPNVAYC